MEYADSLTQWVEQTLGDVTLATGGLSVFVAIAFTVFALGTVYSFWRLAK